MHLGYIDRSQSTQTAQAALHHLLELRSGPPSLQAEDLDQPQHDQFISQLL